MDEEGLTKEFIQALIDRYTAVELCDLLDISTKDFVEAFEDVIVDCFEELCEDMQWRNEDECEGEERSD